MTAVTYPERRLRWPVLLERAWQFNPTLTLATLFHFGIIPLLLLGAVIDPKVITGMPAWIKPLKFAISGGIYTVTFGWLLTYVQGRRRWVQLAATVTGVALLVETVLITMQVIRGVPSHFNASTAFDAAVFSAMGLFILLLSIFNFVLIVLLAIQRMPDRVFAWALRLAVIGSFLGMMVGNLMTSPTPEQMTALQAGESVAAIGAHSVGVADGGAGLPILGWSTEGGDLRIGHFLGLHALQVLPLAGWALTRRRARQLLPEIHRLILVWTAGLGYFGLTGLVTWQALRGQPIVAPDGLILVALAVLVGFVSVAVLGTWAHGRRAI